MRVMTPKRVPAKFGMPAAPLLMMVSRPPGKGKIAQGGKAGVGRGEHIDLCGAAHIVEPARRCGLSSSSCAKRQPASEVASPCTMPMRKAPTCATRCIGSRASCSRAAAGAAAAQQRQDLVRAGAPRRRRRSPDRRSRSRRRCPQRARSRSPHCRAAPDAARRGVRRAANQSGSASNQWKSPLNTIVAGVRSMRRQTLDRLERGEIAVEPADHIERLGDEIRRAREHAWRIAVVERANAAGRSVSVGASRRCERRRVHSAASFSAPPQLEPWPAVQP